MLRLVTAIASGEWNLEILKEMNFVSCIHEKKNTYLKLLGIWKNILENCLASDKLRNSSWLAALFTISCTYKSFSLKNES